MAKVFEQITANAAQDIQWDVIIAGSSFASMFFLKGLPEGLKVLVVEKGMIRDHASQLVEGEIPITDFEMVNTSGHAKVWVARTAFGGNSNCWWGQVPRFHPSDFRLFEDYGVGAPWPIDYDALEPFYVQVEEIMEIAGGGNEAILPRSRAFPHPPQALSRSDAKCMEARPDIWVPVPTARATGGSRRPAAATACANCARWMPSSPCSTGLITSPEMGCFCCLGPGSVRLRWMAAAPRGAVGRRKPDPKPGNCLGHQRGKQCRDLDALWSR